MNEASNLNPYGLISLWAQGDFVIKVVTLALVRRMATMLFGVSPTDMLTIAAVATLLLIVAVLACWLPGRRAARIRPLEAISTE